MTTIYACTDDGLAIFNKPGTLGEWLPPRRVLSGSSVMSVWAEPGPPVRVLAVQGDSLLLSENGGRTWEQIATERTPLALFMSPADRRLYAALKRGALTSSADGGGSWRELPNLPAEATSLLVEECGSYLVADGQLYGGDPEAGEWRTCQDGSITAVTYDIATNTLYASTTDSILKSGDGGSTWTALPGSPGGVSALLSIQGAEGKAPALVAGASGGLWVSPDGGETWQQHEVAGSIRALARDPERRDRLYAATSGGAILESGKRGQSWTAVNAVPLTTIYSLFVMRI